MTDFNDVRIPGTRTGSGIRRVTLPSQVVRVGGPRSAEPGQLVRNSHEVGNAPLARLRRHITKGFYDLWPEVTSGEAPGEDIVDIVTDYSLTVTTGFMTVLQHTINSFPISRSLPRPGGLGHILVISMYDDVTPLDIGNVEYEFDNPSERYRVGTSEYVGFTTYDAGDNITFMALMRSGGLQWTVLDINGQIIPY